MIVPVDMLIAGLLLAYLVGATAGIALCRWLWNRDAADLHREIADLHAHIAAKARLDHAERRIARPTMERVK